MRAHAPGEEAGSGSLLAVGVVSAVCLLTVGVVSAEEALVVHRRVAVAADSAALAAADTASGLVGGVSCERARRAAELGGAELAECEVTGLVARVAAHTTYLGFDITVAARAGPPGTS